MKKHLSVLLILLLSACTGESITKDKINFSTENLTASGITEAELYDKILGMLVGAAIGDAMGAPTEMWSRQSIDLEYGFVDGLDSMVREVSPEGTWKTNLPAGGTTDDTRWKKLTAEYLLTQSINQLNAKDFASHLLMEYRKSIKAIQKIESTDSEPFEHAMLQINWLSEWAKVSEPYVQDNLQAYSDSLSKFYGGEMVCAGLLYAPTLGSFFPGNPEKAYQEAYRLSIFDLGYARDLTGLAAAMTAAGMKPGASKTDLLAALRLDPQGYFPSRLVGRTSYKILREALSITAEAHKLDSLPFLLKNDSPALAFAYTQLDAKQQDMPFHAGEIYLQSITAMLYTNFDFLQTLIFLTNYGRDNDTTAALSGGILGAWYGFSQLPEKEKNQVLKINKKELGIDLEDLAEKLTAKLINR